MRIEVRVESGDGELRSLHSWLRDEPDVRRTANLELVEQPPQPGEMGTVADVLQLVTDNGWSAANFTVALLTWRQTRRRDPRVTVQRGSTVVTLTEFDDAELQRVINMLESGRAGEEPRN